MPRQVRGACRYVLVALALALLALLVSLRSAEVARRGRALVSLGEEAAWLQAENRRLEAALLALESPERIEREAERMGFVRPEAVAALPRAAFLAYLPAAGPSAAGGGPMREVRLALPPGGEGQPYNAAGLLSGLARLPVRILTVLGAAF